MVELGTCSATCFPHTKDIRCQVSGFAIHTAYCRHLHLSGCRFDAPHPMPGYLTKQESIHIDGAQDMQIRSLLDRQQFFDPDGAALRLGISDAIWPLFGLLWPSGSELANHMAQQPVIQGRRILELGCGLGLASLVCHRMGADITASDCHPLAGDFLKENLRLNDLPPMKYRAGQWGALESIAAAAEATAHFDAAAQTTALAGSLPGGFVAPVADLPVRGVFDLIIGSDLLYERDQFARLPNYICEHASASAQIWIIDPDRGNRAAFSRQMAERGYGVTETRLDRTETELQAGYKGRLLVYAKPPRPMQ